MRPNRNEVWHTCWIYYLSLAYMIISVRSTNVYEERSLGIYEADSDEDPDDQPLKQGVHSRARYFLHHPIYELSLSLAGYGESI
jgi:Trk/Ktr/HKT type cation transporter